VGFLAISVGLLLAGGRAAANCERLQSWGALAAVATCHPAKMILSNLRSSV